MTVDPLHSAAADRINTTGLTAHPSRLSASMPVVQGVCPACHARSLFLAQHGYVTCAVAECPDPTAANSLLEPSGEAAQVASPSEELESWDGLMEQLDRHYPADLMANWPDDPGPRIVALIRQIDAIRQEAALRTTKEGEDG